MRGRGNKHAPKQMSAHYNHVAAFAKVGTAPLERLDDAMIESIAASHARRGTPAFNRLLTGLREVVAMRRERDAA